MLHDFGSVRLYENEQVIEVHCSRGDVSTRTLVKRCGARFDGARKTWKVTTPKGREREMVERIRSGVLAGTPPGWQKALPTIGKIVATTNRYQISIGEGGVRLELPRGDVHEWTLKNEVEGAEFDRPVWVIPAAAAAGAKAKKVIQDSINGDQRAFRSAVDYLDGFFISGELEIDPDAMKAIGLEVGAYVAADPSFVRLVDKDIPKELNKAYPLKVVSLEPSEEDRIKAKFAFFTGADAYKWLRDQLSAGDLKRTPWLDVGHVHGRWTRRRS